VPWSTCRSGGAKGGVQVDPMTLSASELERLTRRYAMGIASMIGPDRDIPAPDVKHGRECDGVA